MTVLRAALYNVCRKEVTLVAQAALFHGPAQPYNHVQSCHALKVTWKTVSYPPQSTLSRCQLERPRGLGEADLVRQTSSTS